MKLRIHGNSVRLRLTQPEVETIKTGGTVSETVTLGDQVLEYALAVADVADVRLSFRNNRLFVELPGKEATNWAASDQVGIYRETPLRIAIEKDFQCLHKEDEEDQSNMFPNPDAAN